MSREQAFAFPAEYLLTERHAVRTVTVPVRAVRFHELFPAVEFFLYRIPCLLIYDSLMAVLYIDLCDLTVVSDLSLGKEVCSIGLLQKCVTHVLFLL